MESPLQIENDVFISYCRRDSKFAALLQKRLEEGFSRLDGKFLGGKKKIVVIRDQEDFGASEDLDDEIQLKIAGSRHFILVCSRHTPESRWVNREIAYFKALRADAKDRKLIVVLLDLPEPISLKDFPSELVAEGRLPLGLDARKEVLRAKGIPYRKHFKHGLLQPVFAAILDCPLHALRDRQARYERKILRRRLAAGTAVFCAAALIGLVLMAKAGNPRLILEKSWLNPLERGNFSSAVAVVGPGRVARGDDHGRIYLIDGAGKKSDSSSLLPGRVSEIKAYGDGLVLALAQGSPALFCWDIKASKVTTKFEVQSPADLSSLAVNPDGRTIAVGDSRGDIWLLDGTKADRVFSAGVTSWGRIRDLDFFARGKRLAYCFQNGPVGYYDLDSRQHLAKSVPGQVSLNFSVTGAGRSVIYSGWAPGLNKYLILKLVGNNRESELARSTSTFGDLNPIAGTGKFVVHDWEGKISIIDADASKELAYRSVEPEEPFFERSIFTAAYDDERGRIYAFTNEGVYLFAIRWESLFGIQSDWLKYF